MKIKSISMTNFVNHPKTVIEPLQVNMILGSCQQGKSAIRDAIEYAILGTARGMNGARGKDYLPMNRVGRGEVEIVLDNIKIRRNTNGKLEIDDMLQEIKTGQAIILKRIGCNAEALEIVFDTMKILNMDALERAKYFNRLFQAKTPADEFADMLRRQGCSQSIIALILPEYERGGLKKVYEYAVNKRREYKRELAELENTKEPEKAKEINGKKINLETTDANYYKKLVYDLTQRAEEIRKKRDRQIQLQGQALQAQNNIKNCESQITHLEAWIKQQSEIYENQTTLSAKIIKTEAEVESITIDLNGVRARLQNTESTWEVVRDLPLCDMCRKQLNKKFQDDINYLKEEQTNLSEQLSDRNKKIEQLRSQIADDIRHEYENKLKQLEAVKADFERLYEIKEKINYDPNDIEKINAELEEVQKLISDNNNILKEIELYDRSVKEYGSVHIKIAQRNIDIATWDKLANIVNPEKNNMVNLVISKLADRINYTAGLLGKEIYLNPDTWDILYKNIPLEFCSGSEKYELGIILSDAVSYLMGVGLLFLDGAEIFVGDRRSRFSDTLMQIAGDYENIFVFASVDKKPEYIPETNIRYIWVEKGAIYV